MAWTFFWLFQAVLIVYLLGMVVQARMMGVGVLEISYGFGPSLASMRWRGTRLSLRWLPLGSSVRMVSETNEAESEAEEGQVGEGVEEAPSGRPFEELSRVEQALMHASGCVVLLLVSLSILGPADALRSVWHGFAQTFLGALNPVTIGAVQIRETLALAHDGDWYAAFGILATKVTAVNLLPIPPLSGAHVLKSLVGPRGYPRWLDSVFTLGFFACLALFCCWAYAAAVALGVF